MVCDGERMEVSVLKDPSTPSSKPVVCIMHVLHVWAALIKLRLHDCTFVFV